MVFFTFFLLFLTVLEVTHSCTKEEYLASFGEAYGINVKGAAIEPGIEGDFLVAEVEYETTCPNGGSSFTTRLKEPAETGMPFSVLIASREKPSCENSVRVPLFKYVGVVAIDLAVSIQLDKLKSFTEQQFKFLAFPPDQEYEVYDLQSRAHTIEKRNIVEEVGVAVEPEPSSADSTLSVLAGTINKTDKSLNEKDASSSISHVIETLGSEL